MMNLKKIAFCGFLFAGVLYLLAGLRDIFAPGFFNVSAHIPSKTDILFQFVLAGTLLALAALYYKMQNQTGNDKK